MRASVLLVCSLLVTMAAGEQSGSASPEAATPALSPQTQSTPAALAPNPASIVPVGSAVPAFRQAKNVAIITIHGEIDGGGRWGNSIMVESVRRRIDTAVKGGADAIVFEIDSPGGEVGAALRLAELIKDCPIKNTVAWVRTHALSGGAIAAISCREIVVTESSTMGDAMPVRMGRGGGIESIDPEMLKKVLPVLISSVVDSARRHNEAMGSYHRDEYLIQSIVANDVALWWIRNPKTGQEMAIDLREFELLFPGLDPNTAARLASIKSLQPTLSTTPVGPLPLPATSQAPTDALPGVPEGSEKLAMARAEAERQQMQGAPTLTRATSRPILTATDVGQWELVDRVSDGSAPATFSALDMAHYNLASNSYKGADGRVVIQSIQTDEDLKAFFGAEHLRRLDKNWSEGLVVWLTNPFIRGLFIAIFIVCLFIEMSHPGASIPGAIAVVALILAIAPSMMIGFASWWEVAAIVVGIGLLILEIFVLPGFGVPGILGLLLLFAGLLGTFLPAGTGLFPKSGQEQSQLLWGLASILAAMLTSGIALYFIAKHFGSVPLLSRFVLRDPGADEESMEWASTNLADPDAPAKVGEVGVALTAMKPAGRVEIDGRVIDAVSDLGWISKGQKIKVVSVSGFRVGVEPRTELPT